MWLGGRQGRRDHRRLIGALRSTHDSTQELLTQARSRVFKRLERAIDFRILVVCAPPGFGKSTILREFFTSPRRAHRCLEVEPNAGDLLGFMRSFADCLGDLVPAFRSSFMAVYQRLERAEGALKDIAGWATAHLAALESTLLIDGLQNVTDDRVFGLLNELVDQTASGPVRWVLVAQSADRFPIGRWLATEQMDLPIDEIDLALTCDDIAAAVAATGLPIASAQVRALCAKTRNWPAAIALVFTDIAGLPELIADPLGQPYEYFAARAFAARSEPERRFLLETCLYRHFEGTVLEAAGWDQADPLLARLCGLGAVIFRDGAAGYRYHEMFRGSIEARLRATPDALYRRISANSAAVCRRTGRWSDALQLYTALQAAEPLAELLSEHGFALVDRGETDPVSQALAVLGETEFTNFPVALAVKASLESLHGSSDLAEAWFRHAIASAHQPGQRDAIVYRFATDLVRQDRRDAIELLQPIVAEGGHDLALSVSLAGLLATAYATHQQGALAASTIERALNQLVDVNDCAVRAKVYFQAGYVAFFARDPVGAKAYAQQAVDTALASHLYDIAARALSILYNVAMDYEDDVCAALSYLDQLALCSIKAGSRHLQMYATLGQFEIEVSRGRLRESARLDRSLQALEVEYSVFASEMLLPAQALRATWNGDFHRAYRLIATTAETQITPMRRAQRYAEIALYAAAAGLRAEAGTAAHQALAIAAAADPDDKSVARAKAYIALTLTLMGRHRRAAKLLAKADRWSALTPRLREFISAVQTINDRWARGQYSHNLRAALDRLDACNFGGIGRLIEALPLPETYRGYFTELTEAEREVLVHLSAEMTAGEIAALSGRTVEGVDALVQSLCRKLGCSSPRYAVALARSADIVRSDVAPLRSAVDVT